MVGLAKEGAEFGLAHFHAAKLDDVDDVFRFERECNFEFHKNRVVGEPRFRHRRGAIAFSAPLDDETVEEGRKLFVAAFDEVRVVIFLQPSADLGAGGFGADDAEEADHLFVVEVENVANAAEDVVVGHGLAIAV